MKRCRRMQALRSHDRCAGPPQVVWVPTPRRARPHCVRHTHSSGGRAPMGEKGNVSSDEAAGGGHGCRRRRSGDTGDGGLRGGRGHHQGQGARQGRRRRYRERHREVEAAQRRRVGRSDRSAPPRADAPCPGRRRAGRPTWRWGLRCRFAHADDAKSRADEATRLPTKTRRPRLLTGVGAGAAVLGLVAFLAFRGGDAAEADRAKPVAERSSPSASPSEATPEEVMAESAPPGEWRVTTFGRTLTTRGGSTRKFKDLGDPVFWTFPDGSCTATGCSGTISKLERQDVRLHVERSPARRHA